MKKVFENLYDVFESRLKGVFGDITVFKETPRQKDAFKDTPAFVIEMSDIEPVKPTGTGEIEVLTRWIVRLVISPENEHERIQARAACAVIAGIFSEQILVNNTYPARYLGSHDLNFGLVAATEAWVSEFYIPMVIGENQYESWDLYPDVLRREK